MVVTIYSKLLFQSATAWQVPKYGVFSSPYFPVFSPNKGKYGPEKASYLDTFHTVCNFQRPDSK